MSLETALAENTAAVRELLDAIKSNALTVAQPAKETPAPKPQAADKSTSAATPADSAPTQPTAEAVVADAQKKTEGASAPSAASAETDVQASTVAVDADPLEETAPPDYPTTARAVTALVKAKGRDAALAVLKSFGADNLKQVPAEKYAEVVTACEEASA